MMNPLANGNPKAVLEAQKGCFSPHDESSEDPEDDQNIEK